MHSSIAFTRSLSFPRRRAVPAITVSPVLPQDNMQRIGNKSGELEISILSLKTNLRIAKSACFFSPFNGGGRQTSDPRAFAAMKFAA